MDNRHQAELDKTVDAIRDTKLMTTTLENNNAPAPETDKIAERAKSLVCTSVDDCRAHLDHYTAKDLPILHRALEMHDAGEGYGGTTRRKLLAGRIKLLEKEATAATPKSKIQNPKSISVPLDKIFVDNSLQIRCENDGDQIDNIKEAMEQGAEMPPIDLFAKDGFADPSYLIGDGWHRYHAAVELKRKEIRAIIHPGGRPAALKHALGANSAHGLRRTNKDKRNAVEIALKEFPKLGDRAIAKLCNVTHPFVIKLRKVVTVTTPTITQTTGNGTEKPTQIDFWKVINESFAPVKNGLESCIESPVWLNDDWPADQKDEALKSIEDELSRELDRVRDFRRNLNKTTASV